MEKLNDFLKELAELTKKYNLKIAGCGCCGSPAVVDMATMNNVDCLDFDEDKQEYTVEEPALKSNGGNGVW